VGAGVADEVVVVVVVVAAAAAIAAEDLLAGAAGTAAFVVVAGVKSRLTNCGRGASTLSRLAPLPVPEPALDALPSEPSTVLMVVIR